MPHPWLVGLNEVEQYGVQWQFSDRFAPRPLLLTIKQAGDLGTMTYTWQAIDQGQQNASGEYPTLAPPGGASWVQRISEAYVDLTWAPGTYVANSTYVVDTTVSANPQSPVAAYVTAGGGAIPGLTARRFDVRIANLQVATDHALGWMAPAVVPPLTSWGSDVRARTAHYWAALLLGINGAAPSTAAAGDDFMLKRGAEAIAWFQAIGAGGPTPADLIDSSSDGTGGGLILLPTSAYDRSRWE